MNIDFSRLSMLTAGFAMLAIVSGCGAGSKPTDDKPRKDLNVEESRFYVLLFPTKDRLVDSSGDSHVVARAALASLAELGNETFSMYIGESQHVFNRSDFSLLAKGATLEQYVRNFNEELKKWGPTTDWRSASFELQEASDNSPTRGHLTLTYKSGRSAVYVYQIDGLGAATPLNVELTY